MIAIAIAAVTVAAAFLATVLYVLIWYKISTYRDRYWLSSRHVWIERDIECESAWSETPTLKDENENCDWRNEYENRIAESNEEDFRALEARLGTVIAHSRPSTPDNKQDIGDPKTPWRYVKRSSDLIQTY